MNTFAALTLVFMQAAITLAALYYNHTGYIDSLITYGSPVYLFTHLEGFEPASYAKHGGMLILSFHTFKYFFLLRAFSIDPPSFQRLFALLLEALYLGISYYCISLL